MHSTNPQAQHGYADLNEAFLAFGGASAELCGAYDSLQARIADLGAELAEARQGKEHLSSRLAALLQALPGGVLVLDAHGRIQECNPAAASLFGEPLIGLEFGAVITRAAAGGGVRAAEHTELKSGRFVNISRSDLGDGGEVVLAADVTESHWMQALMSRQQRLLTLGELAAGLAHQIRTPLAAALLYASQMTLPDRDPKDLARCAQRTADSLKQLDRLVTDMLAFAHGGAAREVVNLGAVLEQVAQWLRPALRDGITITIRTEAPRLCVRANASSLISAVLNLATNALQAAAGKVALELAARHGAAGRAEIVVSDDGPGVPRHLRERIFEPFFTTRTRGNGIGLAIVKSVVAAHHGSVRLADSAAGATFVIDLPAEDGA